VYRPLSKGASAPTVNISRLSPGNNRAFFIPSLLAIRGLFFMKINFVISGTCCYLYDMAKEKKETYTYTTLPSIKKKAAAKSEREGYPLSVRIDMLLREYVKPQKRAVSNEDPVFGMPLKS
jgi:hypothetical protein